MFELSRSYVIITKFLVKKSPNVSLKMPEEIAAVAIFLVLSMMGRPWQWNQAPARDKSAKRGKNQGLLS